MLYLTKFNCFGALKGHLKLSEGSSIVLMAPLGNGDGATILSQTYFSSLGFKSSACNQQVFSVPLKNTRFGSMPFSIINSATDLARAVDN